MYGKPVDAIVTSPPFNARTPSTNTPRHLSKTHGMDMIRKQRAGYPSRKGNIGNLPYKGVDAIVTSPPFGEAQSGGGIAKKGYRGPKHGPTDLVGRRAYTPENVGGSRGNISKMPYGRGIDAVITSPPYEKSISKRGREEPRERIADRLRKAGFSEGYIRRYFTDNPSDNKMKGMGVCDAYSADPGNIGNLPSGKIDSVIFSPPYSGSMSKRRKGYTTHPGLSKTRHMGADSSDENIGNLDHGKVDLIMTSPPYSESLTGKRDAEKEIAGWERRQPDHPRLKTLKRRTERGSCFVTRDYSQSKKNIGNLPAGDIDSIVTSPPYSEALCRTGAGRTFKKQVPHDYSDNGQNIGNLKNQSYLSEMFKIYRECYSVLRPGGFMVLVLKVFVRNKTIQRLDLDTLRLCNAAGFRLVDVKLFRLKQRSFWRILQLRKFGDQIEDKYLLDYEIIQIFEKPLGVCA